MQKTHGLDLLPQGAARPRNGPPKQWDIAMDANTLEALKQRDAGACRRVVTAYAPILLRTAQRVLNDKHEAEDVVQETFIKAFAHLGALENASCFEPWLKRIALNQALSRYRARKRSKEQSIDYLLPRFDGEERRMDWPDETLVDAETSLHNAHVQRVVREAINHLPEVYRIAIVMRDIEEMSTREAADTLGIEESALKVRLHRARAALRTLLEPARRAAAA